MKTDDMSCPDFMEGFSAFVDGEATAAEQARVEAHMARCPECRRYHEVYERGISLLRSFPDVAVDDDFRPDLEVRLRRDTATALRQLDRPTPSSGSTMAIVLGMAVVLIGAAWVPFLLPRTEEVRLDPLVAAYPTRGLPGALPEIRLLDGRRRRGAGATPFTSAGLFAEPSSLLREYAPVLRGYQAGGVSLGLD